MGAGRTRAPSARRAPAGGGDHAVSPVVGAVLVLGISVFGIVAVTNWGLPAIAEMRASLELNQVLDQFQDLDATLQQLAAGTAGQTTFKWQPSISKGAVDVNRTGNRWLSAVDVRPWVNLTWTEVSDEDHQLKVISNVTVYNLKFKAWTWDGGAATERRINKTDNCGAGSTPDTLTGGVVASFWMHVNDTGCANVRFENVVTSFEVWGSSSAGGSAELLHMAWMVDVGHVHWNSVDSTAAGPNHVYATNGGVVAGTANNLLMKTTLGVAPPRNFTNSTGAPSTSLFVRFVKMQGNASFSGVSGGERHSIFLNLVGTYTLGTVANATSTYVYVWGNHKEAAFKGLTDTVDGYRFHRQVDPTTLEEFLRHKEGGVPFRVSAVYSLVRVDS